MPPAKRPKYEPHGWIWNRYKYGNYVGAGWSAGAYGDSRAFSDVPPFDEYDSTALSHDKAYRLHGRTGFENNKYLKSADYKFMKDNVGKSVERTVAGSAVGFQGYMRNDDSVGKELVVYKPPFLKKNRMVYARRHRTLAMRRAGRTRPGFTLTSRSRYRTAVSGRRRLGFSAQVHRPLRYAGNARTGRRSRIHYSRYRPRIGNGVRKFQGLEFRNEVSGIWSAAGTETIYLGHAIPMYKMVDVFWGAILKSLFNSCSWHFADWSSSMKAVIDALTGNITYAVEVRYRADGNDTATVLNSVTYFAPAAVDLTWLALAQQVRDDFRTNCPSAYNDAPQLFSISMYAVSETVAAPDISIGILLSTIDLRQYHVDFEFFSQLAIQNRTPALNTGTVEEDTFDIGRNPLTGKLYRSFGSWINGFDLKVKTIDSSSDSTALFADGTTGLIKLSSVLTHPAQLKKPPPEWVLGAKAKRAFVEPGAIKNDTIRFKCSMLANTFLQKVPDYISAVPPNAARVSIGKASMFGLELKMACATSLPAIVLGYEHNFRIKASGYTRVTRTLPNVNTSYGNTT